MIRTFGSLLTALAMLAACGGSSPDRPNIVLITVDALRWDYLNAYGYPEPGTTPSMDYLAAQGLVFDNAITTMGSTVPAHASMLTGLYARQHGARSNFHGLYPGIPTIAGALEDAGYETGAFVSNANILHVGQLGREFGASNMPRSDADWLDSLPTGDRTVARAADWMSTIDAGDPIFVWLHLWEPHGPYDLNDWSKARLGDYQGMLKEGVSLEQIRNDVRKIVSSPRHLAALRTLYAGEVHQADRHLGLFLDRLRSMGRLDNTLVILTADHGQSLGEEGRMGHGPNHRETVMRVPLVIADFRDGARGRIQTRVSNIDIAPTIAAAAGLRQSFSGAGRSLLDPAGLAEDWNYYAEVALRLETDRNWHRVKDSRAYDPYALAVYAGPFKLTFRGGKYQLWETAVDRTAARRLKRQDFRVIFDQLRGRIESFQETELDFSPGEATPESVERLKSLGYTQ